MPEATAGGSGTGSPRVLIVAQLDAAERGLTQALVSRGFRIAALASAMDAVRTLRRDGADAVVLGLPLGGADPVAVCAALKEGEYAPALLLADASGQAEALEAALPEEYRPDALLPRPLEPAKLAIALHGCLAARAEGPGETPGVSVAELLMELKRRRSSEVLEIRAADVCTRVHLRDGQPVFAEGGSLQETLGRQLVRRGAIGHDDYVRVVARMTEDVIHHQSLRLGEVLVELGLLSPAEVYDALALQVREKIVACFQWDRFAFELHDEPFDDPDDLGIYQCPPTEALVLAGVRAHFGPDRLGPLLAPHARALAVLRASYAALVPLFQPSPPEQRLLRAIDGSQPVEALVGAGILDPVHAQQVLAALSLADALAFRSGAFARGAHAGAPARPAAAAAHPAPAPARAAAAPARGAHPPARPASPAAGRSPAEDASATRPVLVGPPKPSSSAPARASFDPLARLRRQTGGGVRAAPRDPKSARLEAENAFHQGLRLVRESAIPGALREFRRAVELAPEEPEYRLLEAWLEYRSAQGGDARALAAAKVRACAKRALQASAASARAQSVLGQLALQEGDEEAAERHLRAALRQDPGDVEASRGLRLLERRAAKAN